MGFRKGAEKALFWAGTMAQCKELLVFSWILASNPHLLQVGVYLLPCTCTQISLTSYGFTHATPLSGDPGKVFLPPSTHTLSPLTEGMQARQNLGAPVPIQADAAHQELLVHGLDLWARAVLPLRHGAHRWLLPLTPACIWRNGQYQAGQHSLPDLIPTTEMPCRELAPFHPCQGQDRQ